MMNVKIETKEKFHVIVPNEAVLSADMTADLTELLQSFLNKTPGNIILKCSDIKEISLPAAQTIMQFQQTFYEQNRSFVICELKPSIEHMLDESGLLEVMNITPTESEAWDIVQMEEIEREYMDGLE